MSRMTERKSALARAAAGTSQAERRPDTAYTARARWFHSGNAFDVKHPPIPRLVFLAERDRAFDPASPTAFIPLDLPHRHNAAALTLCVAGEGCYSLIDGEPVGWSRHAVMGTPPGGAHAHYNGGDELTLSWVIQDGGLHDHTRTMDFAYAED
jgi:hypothetical protein